MELAQHVDTRSVCVYVKVRFLHRSLRNRYNLIDHTFIEIMSSSRRCLTRNKIISTSPRMRNNPRKLILPIKNNPIRPRRSTIIYIPITQDRKLIVRARNWEFEPLVVVVFVWVGVVRLAGAVEVVSSGLGGAYGAAGVADGAASVGAGAFGGGCVGAKGKEEEEGWECESLLVLVGLLDGWGWWCTLNCMLMVVMSRSGNFQRIAILSAVSDLCSHHFIYSPYGLTHLTPPLVLETRTETMLHPNPRAMSFWRPCTRNIIPQRVSPPISTSIRNRYGRPLIGGPDSVRD